MEAIAVLMTAGGGERMNAKLHKTLHLLEGKAGGELCCVGYFGTSFGTLF